MANVYDTYYDDFPPIDAATHIGPWCDDCGAPVDIIDTGEGRIVVDATRRWHVCPNQFRNHFGRTRYAANGTFLSQVVLCGLTGFRETTEVESEVDCKRCLAHMERNRRLEQSKLDRRAALKGDRATVYYP